MPNLAFRTMTEDAHAWLETAVEAILPAMRPGASRTDKLCACKTAAKAIENAAKRLSGADADGEATRPPERASLPYWPR